MSEQHKHIYLMEADGREGINGLDPSALLLPRTAPDRLLETIKEVLALGHDYGLSQCKSGLFWAAHCKSPRSGLYVAIDLDLLAIVEKGKIARFIEVECLAHEEELCLRIESGWKPEL